MKHKIMVVDSDMLQVIEVEAALKDAGYDVVSLTTSNGVFAQVEYENPDALIVDASMDGLNANDLFDSLQSSTAFDDVVVILFSALPPNEMATICQQHELNGYFSKELELDKLVAYVQKFFDV